MQQIVETVRALLDYPKGLLAMDESNGACHKRFAAAGIPHTVEARRAYRENPCRRALECGAGRSGVGPR